MKTKEEKFILKEDGLIYLIENCPEEPVPYGIGDEQYYGSRMDAYNEALQSAIDNAIEVSNQEEVRHALLKKLNWNPHPDEHRFDVGTVYSLECNVQILPWSTLRIYSTGGAHKDMPLKGNGALVTFPESKEDNPIRTKEEILADLSEKRTGIRHDYTNSWILEAMEAYHSQFSSSYRSGEESKPDQP